MASGALAPFPIPHLQWHVYKHRMHAVALKILAALDSGYGFALQDSTPGYVGRPFGYMHCCCSIEVEGCLSRCEAATFRERCSPAKVGNKISPPELRFLTALN
jgi:hypothetical protein